MTDAVKAELPSAMLEDLFERFTEASGKLEKKYEALLYETNELRGKLREKDKEIERAERLSVLGETAAAIAHEIRNPLCSVKLFVSLLKEEVKDLPKALEYINEVDTSMIRLDGVISNILHFSKEQALVSAPVNINSLLQEQIACLTQIGFSGIRSCLYLEGNPFILGNEDGLRQVLSNLLRNSAQSCGSGGTITVRTWDEADDLVIQIEDSGGGIPEDVLDKIFDPFVSTKSEGTGLGLAIVKRIICQHGGEVSAKNITEGAQFTFSLKRRSQLGGKNV